MAATTRRTDVLREAKAKSAELRDALKGKADPSDPDIEFLRQNLRRLYLTVLFSDRSTRAPASTASTAPSTGRLLDVLNLLWIETSHSLIHVHRQRVSALDKDIRKRQAGGSTDSPRSSKANGPVARRKLVHSLRSFLAAEEAFWASTIARFVETYDVRDAEPAVRALKISMAPLAARPASSTVEDVLDGADAVDPKDALGRQQGLLLVHRALISFGDLARYRELYSESNNAASTADQAAAAARQRSYARAAECYHQARLLIPDDGNPSNQLAVLASYNQDTLSSVYHYYRALSVRNAFSTARQNLAVTFTKALAAESTSPTSENVASAFVGLHARLFLHKQLDEVPQLSIRCVALLSAALPHRDLSSDAIVKLVGLALAAWWDLQMQQSDAAALGLGLALGHVHAVIAALHAFAADELQARDGPDADAAVDSGDADALAMLISPELRRALPALRIASKWLLRHVEDARDPVALETLWPAYAKAANVLADLFPVEGLAQLPRVPSGDGATPGAFEEDVDMVAFLPLGASNQHSSGPVRAASPFTAAHPNQEHLLRVAGLMADQQLLAHGQGSPVAIVDDTFVCIPPELAASFAASRQAALRRTAAVDASPQQPSTLEHLRPGPVRQVGHLERGLETRSMVASANGGDEDDIVGEAFRAVSLGQGGQVPDDRALFPSANAPLPPPLSSSAAAPHSPPPAPSLNAQDLLRRVLGDPSAGGQSQSQASTLPPPSIWAPTGLEQQQQQRQPQYSPHHQAAAAWGPPMPPPGHQQHHPPPPPVFGPPPPPPPPGLGHHAPPPPGFGPPPPPPHQQYHHHQPQPPPPHFYSHYGHG